MKANDQGAAMVRRRRCIGLTVAVASAMISSLACAAIPVPKAPPVAKPPAATTRPSTRAARPAPAPRRVAAGIWQASLRYPEAYTGYLEVAADGQSAILVLNYEDSGTQKRVRQDCDIDLRPGSRVDITCRNPQMLRGTDQYRPDRFDLELRGDSAMRGAVIDSIQNSGTAEFTR